MTEEVATTPAAESSTPAAPQSSVDDSLLAPLADASKPAESKPAEPAAKTEEAKPAEAEASKWFYADGTPGKGEAPAWYLADKYKTVEEQAKAYPELQKRLGAFVGAPTDGKYEFKTPDGARVQWQEDHPMLTEFTKWAKDNQLSQEGYQHLRGILHTYEESRIPDINQIKAEIGDNADARIAAMNSWSRANLGHDEYNVVREAVSGANAAKALKAIEAVVAKTRQVAMPKPGEDVAAGVPNGLAGIKHLMEAKDSKGQLKYFTDEAYRNDVDKKTRAFHEAQGKAA